MPCLPSSQRQLAGDSLPLLQPMQILVSNFCALANRDLPLHSQGGVQPLDRVVTTRDAIQWYGCSKVTESIFTENRTTKNSLWHSRTKCTLRTNYWTRNKYTRAQKLKKHGSDYILNMAMAPRCWLKHWTHLSVWELMLPNRYGKRHKVVSVTLCIKQQ